MQWLVCLFIGWSITTNRTTLTIKLLNRGATVVLLYLCGLYARNVGMIIAHLLHRVANFLGYLVMMKFRTAVFFSLSIESIYCHFPELRQKEEQEQD